MECYFAKKKHFWTKLRMAANLIWHLLLKNRLFVILSDYYFGHLSNFESIYLCTRYMYIINISLLTCFKLVSITHHLYIIHVSIRLHTYIIQTSIFITRKGGVWYILLGKENSSLFVKCFFPFSVSSIRVYDESPLWSISQGDLCLSLDGHLQE